MGIKVKMREDKEPEPKEIEIKKGAYPNITLALYCFGILITGVFLGITISLKMSGQQSLHQSLQSEEGLKKLSPSFADAVRIASPSVVNIEAKMEFYKAEQKPSHQKPETQKTDSGPQHLGCGIIFSGDGYILTANHVVPSYSKIRVTTQDNKDFDAQLIGSDSYTDLAVIKINATNLPAAKIANIKNLKRGDACIAIGSPFGYDQSVSSGVVSALDRVLHLDHHVNYIQTDAGVGPGNSGGPLINPQGEVIGVLSKAVISNQRIQLAVPIDLAMSVAESLKQNKKVSRPFIGIYFQDVFKDAKTAHTLNINPIAVSVGKLVPGSPAKNYGIMAGDIIKKADDTAVTSAQEIRAILKTKKVGDKLTLELSRKNQTLKKIILLEEYPANL